MKDAAKSGHVIAFTVAAALLGPLMFPKLLEASFRNGDTTVQAVLAAETQKVRDRIFQIAAGKCSIDTGCPASGDTAASRKRPEGEVWLAASDSHARTMAGETETDGPEAGRSGKGGLLPTVPRVQALTHVIGSHAAVVTRPVTAGKRLFFLVYDTLKDALGWPAVSATAGDREVELSEYGTMDLEAWERRLDEMTGSATSYGNLEFLVGGEEFFPRFLDSVAGARRSVYIRTYIFDNDDFALEVAETLKERSREVDVRILMDGLGTIMATGVRPKDLPREHEPPRSMRNFLMSGSGVRVRQQFNPWFTGDHSKTVIVDGERAFVGGMNFGREYRYEWHDLMVEVKGPVVRDIKRDFGKAWAGGGLLGDIESFFYSLKGRGKTSSKQGYPVRLLYTRPGDSEIRNTQLEAIRRSGKYIYLENPYLTDDQVLDELVKASKRGVDVRVVLPSGTNSGIITRSNTLAANRMLKSGIRVYHLPRMSHVKAAVYDGWACFGSANFDKFSFRVNYELNLATSHEPTVRKLIDRLFIPDFEASVELGEELPVRAHDFLMELLADQL